MNVSPQVQNEKSFGYPHHRTAKGDLVWGVRLENRKSRQAEYTITVTAMPQNDGTFEYQVEAAHGKIGQGQKFTIYDVMAKPGTSSKNVADALAVAKNLMNVKKGRDYSQVEEAVPEVPEDGPQVVQFDPFVKDDKTVGGLVEEEKRQKFINDDTACDCIGSVEELAWSFWKEPLPADESIAPFLTQPGFEMVRFITRTPSSRWVVGSFSTCSGGYPHARAVLVNSPSGKVKPPTPQYVAQTVMDSVAKDAQVRGVDFVLVLEEAQGDWYVVDALRWGGEDLTSEGWLARREKLEQTFQNVFPHTNRARQVRMQPRVVQRLRETYLTETDQYRFELYSEEGLIGQEAWVLP